jgi:hypothetical protein
MYKYVYCRWRNESTSNVYWGIGMYSKTHVMCTSDGGTDGEAHRMCCAGGGMTEKYS